RRSRTGLNARPGPDHYGRRLQVGPTAPPHASAHNPGYVKLTVTAPTRGQTLASFGRRQDGDPGRLAGRGLADGGRLARRVGGAVLASPGPGRPARGDRGRRRRVPGPTSPPTRGRRPPAGGRGARVVAHRGRARAVRGW